MIGEVAIGGIFVMRTLISLLISPVIVMVLRRVLARCGIYRFAWHRLLFDLALLVIVLGGVVAATDSRLSLRARTEDRLPQTERGIGERKRTHPAPEAVKNFLPSPMR